MRRRRKKAIPPTPRAASKSAVLDVFTEQDLERWSARAALAQRYSDNVYFELERQRAERYDELCEALRTAPRTRIALDNWARIVDYRWSLSPLSSAGSLKGIGGRFNVGEDIDRARGQAFPALYIAENVDTAFAEFFGGLPKRGSPLTLHELALRRRTSFTTFTLAGVVEDVLDLRTHHPLEAFSKVISQFRLPTAIQRFARENLLKPRWLARSAKQLHERILIEPAEWRSEPHLFGIPASNQVFGRIAHNAGVEALLYPSQQGGTLCLALFPRNLQGSDSSVRVIGTAPPLATCLVVDKENPCTN